MHVCVHVCMYVCMYVGMYVYMIIYVYIHILPRYTKAKASKPSKLGGSRDPERSLYAQ